MPNLHREGKVITEPSEVPESCVRATQRFHQFRQLESGNRRLRAIGAEGTHNLRKNLNEISESLGQRAKAREVRRLRVRIILKSSPLSYSNLADFGIGTGGFPTPTAFRSAALWIYDNSLLT